VSEHRNIKRKRFCPQCEHGHFPEGMNGMCLLNPPTVFLIGMAPANTIVNPKDPAQFTTPVLRAYYPIVGKNETCSKFEIKTEGEA
jgi:hypothetical protein